MVDGTAFAIEPAPGANDPIGAWPGASRARPRRRTPRRRAPCWRASAARSGGSGSPGPAASRPSAPTAATVRPSLVVIGGADGPLAGHRGGGHRALAAQRARRTRRPQDHVVRRERARPRARPRATAPTRRSSPTSRATCARAPAPTSSTSSTASSARRRSPAGCLAGITRRLILEWYGAREVDEPIEVLAEQGQRGLPDLDDPRRAGHPPLERPRARRPRPGHHRGPEGLARARAGAARRLSSMGRATGPVRECGGPRSVR